MVEAFFANCFAREIAGNMLCQVCQGIYDEPRQVGYGNYYAWPHTKASFLAAIANDCHLCNLLREHMSYSSCEQFERLNPKAALECTYAFKVLSEQWARGEHKQKWLSPQYRRSSNPEEESKAWRLAFYHDPWMNSISDLVKSESYEEIVGNLRNR